MVRIVKKEDNKFYVSVIGKETELLLEDTIGCKSEGAAWFIIPNMMYQFGSTCCLVENQTEQPHAIYRLYEDGTKEKLPIQVRNSEANGVKNTE